MKITILVDNISKSDLKKEWGLSVFIDYNNKKYLLDTGSSNKYLDNSKKLGIDISQVDYAILSHAHYDHSSGFDSFFENNEKAKLFINHNVEENCYTKFLFMRGYVGIKKGFLTRYNNRIQKVKDVFEIDKDVYLMEHKCNNYELVGKKKHLYILKDKKIIPDNFNHEQNLIINTSKGLVVFNSCSHIGANNILMEIEEKFHNQHIYMLIGGFHLAASSKKEVEELSQKLQKMNIDKIYTGHCTGNKAYKILKSFLNDRIEQIYSGLVIEI